MFRSIFNNLLLSLMLFLPLSCTKSEISEDIKLYKGPMEDGDYYVATWGDDNNPGTFDSPWATWQKAFSTAEPGETVYFRGGVYHANGGAVIEPYRWPAGNWGHSGTEGNWIRYLNYPGENPILDLSKFKPEGNWNVGIGLSYITYVHFRGLAVRNVYQYRNGVTARGIEAYGCSNLIFENIIVHNVSGRSFGFFGGYGAHDIDPLIPNVPYDTVRYINCDSYNNCDSLDIGSRLGGIADGFKFNNTDGSYVEFIGCRAWHNSDDGFDANGACFIYINRCWSFDNGYLEGDGYGYKLAGPENGYPPSDPNALIRLFTHNLSAFNNSTGIGLNFGSGRYMFKGHFYNNTFYKNLYGITQSMTYLGDPQEVIFRNNLAYLSTKYNFDNIGAYIAENNNFNNKWPFDYRIQTSDGDFESVSPIGLKGPRKADGSLPDINFLKLKKGSALAGLGYSE